ncbi:hypothetical protein [Hyunsoonleella pacifica]|uniref:Uncharacterized protein n=1 Tax=Hyunsoonleella pacifica TaxID=1080224 RepID=A0A4Q9FQD6_9FLAO|nr:hypothetical protein [Hyunsoonleella pacifica]TBN17715.1 hypothetical protein EYD46_05200 [Hyunsoonleella pacifica]GGD09564.1 hypothetical protein GCM10011368_09420 [Hyunsoonleella pacifica]
MKNYIYIMALLICVPIMAQEKPTEIKKETKVKEVKYTDGDKTKEGKIKVVTKETSKVKLDADDKYKLNQDRVPTDKKVTTTIMIDNDADKAYDVLTSETYYISADKDYKFSPNTSGFMMALANDKNEFVEIGKAWNTHSPGSYIIKGETFNGIGYFDKDGSFIVEYYDEDSESIKTITYNEKEDAM